MDINKDTNVMHPLRSFKVTLLVCVAVWYFCNGSYSMSLKRKGVEYQSVESVLLLIWTIYLIGWISTLISVVIFNAVHHSGQNGRHIWIFTSLRASLLPIAAHWIGNTFTVLAFLAGSIASVQVFKSFGPFFTAMFSLSLEKKEFPKRAILPLLTLCVGIALSTWKNSSFSVEALMLCLSSGISLPLRNVLVKKIIPSTEEGAHKFVQASRIAFSFNLGAWVLTTAIWLILSASYSYSVGGTTNILHMIEIGFLRTIYETASMLTLLQVDTVIHGALDVSKRAIMTVLDLFFLSNVLPNLINVVGSIVALGSLFWFKYILGVEKSSSQTVHMSDRARRILASTLILLLFVLSASSLLMYVAANKFVSTSVARSVAI